MTGKARGTLNGNSLYYNAKSKHTITSSGSVAR